MIRNLAKKYGYKQEIVKRYVELFGEDTEALLKANDAKPKVYIRVNTIKIAQDYLKERLQKRGIRLREVEGGFLVEKSPFSISSTPEYLLGYMYVQGVAEMQIAPLLDPEELVIDMCAAPGGKTTHSAQIMENKGVIIALDVDKDKIKALKANIHRLGVTNTVVYLMSAMDFPCMARRILLDAPCTGSGIIRKDPTRKYSRDSKDIQFCSHLQKDLLRRGIENLKENGILVYSTCSLEPEEDEMIIDWALNHFSVKMEYIDFSVNGISAVEGFVKPFEKELQEELRFCRRTLPHIHDCNGMFVAKLRKSC